MFKVERNSFFLKYHRDNVKNEGKENYNMDNE